MWFQVWLASKILSPIRRSYRKFKIETFKGQDDFAAVQQEVVLRRYKRLIEENTAPPRLGCD